MGFPVRCLSEQSTGHSSSLPRPLPNPGPAAGLFVALLLSSPLAVSTEWHAVSGVLPMIGNSELAKRERTFAAMRLGFHGHETFSSKVREMAYSPYLPLQASSFPGWPRGVLTHTRRGCERGNVQGEQGRESRNPGIGMQEMRAHVGRKGCAMSAALWEHTVKPALWVPVLRSSYDFTLEESLNSILLWWQHCHSPSARGGGQI